jgi:hypothetical protein
MELSGKEIAKKKQIDFKTNVLKLKKSGVHAGKEYKYILDKTDSEKGYNFYCYNSPEWTLLQDWANKNTGQEKKGKRVNFNGEGLRNMLRSEHIPYNMFFPLAQLQKSNHELVKKFLERLIPNIKISRISKIRIEYVSEVDKKDLLDDNTSFDAYIEYSDGNKKCGLGIELKYTEKSYPYGNTEEKRLFNEKSEYNHLTKKCGYFNYEFYKSDKRKLKKIKQLWRNHLLGIKLVDIGELEVFHSVHIYPRGNKYQKQVCDEYIKCLSKKGEESFIPVEFERFVSVAHDTFGNQNWIEYLEKRYLFENDNNS